MSMQSPDSHSGNFTHAGSKFQLEVMRQIYNPSAAQYLTRLTDQYHNLPVFEYVRYDAAVYGKVRGEGTDRNRTNVFTAGGLLAMRLCDITLPVSIKNEIFGLSSTPPRANLAGEWTGTIDALQDKINLRSVHAFERYPQLKGVITDLCDSMLPESLATDRPLMKTGFGATIAMLDELAETAENELFYQITHGL